MPIHRIEVVEALARDPGLCRVKVGAESFGPLRRDDADRLRLRPGVRWTAKLEAAVSGLVRVAKARRAAMAALARASVSRERLQARLEARGHDAEAVTVALEQLRTDGWLDDRASADRRAEALVRRRAVSRGALEATLENEGYAEHARRAARSAVGDASEVDLAVRTIDAGGRRRRPARSVARELARRGFDSDTIVAALARRGLRLDDEHSDSVEG